jgi:hypothetical protein
VLGRRLAASFFKADWHVPYEQPFGKFVPRWGAAQPSVCCKWDATAQTLADALGASARCSSQTTGNAAAHSAAMPQKPVAPKCA